MTGRRPDHTRVFTNGEMSAGGPQDAPPCPQPNDVGPPPPPRSCKKWKNAPANGSLVYFRVAMGAAGRDVITFPQWFKQNGWHTSGGKCSRSLCVFFRRLKDAAAQAGKRSIPAQAWAAMRARTR